MKVTISSISRIDMTWIDGNALQFVQYQITIGGNENCC